MHERATSRRSVTLDVDYPAEVEYTTGQGRRDYLSSISSSQTESAQCKGTKVDSEAPSETADDFDAICDNDALGGVAHISRQC